MKIIAITPDRKRDYTTELTLEGLRDLGCNVIVSDAGNGIEEAASEESILETHDADAVIAFFGKVRGNRPPKYHLLDDLKKRYKTAYIDGSEWTCTGYPSEGQMSDSLSKPERRRGHPWINQHMKDITDFYYKRECYPQDLEEGIIPLPFCLSSRHISETVNKDIDVMCVFGHSLTGMRREVVQECMNLRSKTSYNIVIADNLDSLTYRSVLSRSKIVIDAWGGGDTCDRFFEAIGSGACCLYQRYNVVVENPFSDFENAVSYWDTSTLIDRLSMLLSSPEISRLIGENGKHHAMKYHTAAIRAQKILNNFQV